jgi:hypothetical protein
MFCIAVLDFMPAVGNILRSILTENKNMFLYENNSLETKDVWSAFLEPGSTEYGRPQQFYGMN